MNPTIASFAALLPLVCLLSACAAPLSSGVAALPASQPVEHEMGHDIDIAPLAALEPTAARLSEAPVAVSLPAAPSEEPRACPAEGTRVLLIGDSLSAGLGPVMAKHAAACGTTFFHHGVVGSHVTQWAHDSWLMPRLAEARPDLVIISMGGNDFGRRDAANVEKGIAMLIAKVRATGARILWISPPTMPFEDRIGVRGMWQAAMGGAVTVDWYPTEELVIKRTEDRIHPTRAGYASLGRSLWQWMSTVSA